MAVSEHEARLATVLDELAIRDVVLALSLEGDTGALDDYGALFTDDGVLESPAGVTVGREAIVGATAERRAGGVVGPGSGARHVVVPGRVTIDGDRAEVRSCYSFSVSDQGRPTVAIVGEYHDVLVRRDGTWKIAHRTVTFG